MGESGAELRAGRIRTVAPARTGAWATAWGWLVGLSVLGVTGVALFRLIVELRRLIMRPFIENGAAIDLLTRYIEVLNWFSRRPVYGTIETADYPPATYVMLRPLLGYESLTVARLVWSFVTIVVLVALAVLVYRHVRLKDRRERWLVALLPLAMFSTAASLRFGQFGLHLLVLVMLGSVLLATRQRSWGRDLGAAGLFTLAMAKPTFSAPFFWVTLAKGGLRTSVMTVAMYVGLTLVAAAYQTMGLVGLIRGWLGQQSHIDLDSAHGNLHAWFAHMGWHEWVVPGSLVVLAIVGVWTWLHRDRDVWLLLGVLGLVARMWSHHRWYDDILLCLPLIALCREVAAARAEGRFGALPATLAALLGVFSIAPYFAFGVPVQGSAAFTTLKVAFWFVLLGYLLWAARRRVAAAALTPAPAVT